ncbi:sensor histidine kinase [Pseudomonas sp.]|uniref:ATP-binding protein n=1 Tax=Pseudomonas sp. TaxID=306 RepID=UPI0026175D42|nr:sensor histidine kinase [Pseudomonas sp.]
MIENILTLEVGTEFDIIAARQRARQIAEACGFSGLDQARISTVVSELARNIYNYAGTGSVSFALSGSVVPQQLLITVADEGAGIADVEQVLSGNYRSVSGMGLGILSARRLMEHFEIATSAAGTRITVGKRFQLQTTIMTAGTLRSVVGQFKALPNHAALSEAQHQNRELTETLSALQARQEELLLMTSRLEERNRNIEALNDLLDDKAVALQQADRSKDEFLATLSHELRGPLSAAGTAATVLQLQSVTPERANQMGSLISRQIAHMSRLVEDLLDVSRVSRGLVQLEKVSVNLVDVVAAAVEQVQAGASLKEHRIEQQIERANLAVLGDRTRLIQVASNLLSNAVRYTSRGGLIRITLEKRGSMTVLRVSDNGQGIKPELIPRLFDLYVQAELSSDRIGGGLGLGLALVKNLVEAHRGSVVAYSAGEGQGSTFTVQLPLQVESCEYSC